MEYVSPEYQLRLDNLAKLLCPLQEVVEVNPLSIPRDEARRDWFNNNYEGEI